MLTILPDFDFTSMAPPSHKLGWNLALGHAREFARLLLGLLPFLPHFWCHHKQLMHCSFVPVEHKFLLFGFLIELLAGFKP
jgi:hypothetical protein